jgi:hypothetical protein
MVKYASRGLSCLLETVCPTLLSMLFLKRMNATIRWILYGDGGMEGRPDEDLDIAVDGLVHHIHHNGKDETRPVQPIVDVE